MACYEQLPVCDAALFFILTLKYPMRQRIVIDPVNPPQYRQRREYPPRVTYIWKFFWSTIETAAINLARCQPPTKFVSIDGVKSTAYCQGSSAAKYLSLHQVLNDNHVRNVIAKASKLSVSAFATW